jgi:hypothetical protein
VRGTGGRGVGVVSAAAGPAAVAALAALAVLAACSRGGGGAQATQTPPVPAEAPRTAAPPTWPDAATTGVPAGTTLTPAGDLVVIVPGETVDARDVRGCVVVDADRVTIRRSRIRCGSFYGIRIMPGRVRTVVEDTEIDGLGNPQGVGLGFDDYVARRLNVHNIGDGLRLGTNVTIEDSWVHGLVHGKGSHNDGLQSDGGGRYVIRHNRVENRYGQTSAILLSTNTAPISDVVVQDNLLAGGGYSLYAGTDEGGPARALRVTGNRFSREYFPRGGYYGPATSSEGAAVWSGNAWADTGETVDR